MSRWLLILAGCTPEAAFVPDFEVRPGVEVATVVGVQPGDPMTLYDADGVELLTILADDQGQANFSYLPAEPLTLDSRGGLRFPILNGTVLNPGEYEIRNDDAGTSSGKFRVIAVDEIPSADLYDQPLDGIESSPISGDLDDPEQGFQYLQMRDGTLLSAMVRFPDPALYGEGPWPTVIEYSGYSPSKPSNPDPGSRIANALGYATVGVNMRGTGCSGGVFDLFNRAQHADGYDIVEIVARQEWAMHGKVGMVGLSYPGISQLFVASTNPPSLAAIVPSSTIADPWEMQWPGGIYNEGFTRTWVEQRNADAAVGGTTWVAERIANGDAQCAENTQLSTQNIDFESFLHGLEFRPPDADDRNLNLLVEQIEAPVHLLGAWQDEQTGALFGSMLDRFDNSPNSKFLLYNGRHVDGYAPDSVARWFEFLEFYVAKRIPKLNVAIRSFGASSYAGEFGMNDYTFSADRFLDFDSYEAALAAYEAEAPVRVRFEVGGAPGQAGIPVPSFEQTFDAWPPPEAEPVTWYAGPDGALLADAPAAEGGDLWSFDPDAGTSNFFGPRGYELMTPLWDLDWTRFAAGDAASYLTPAFEEDTVIAGPGVAELWISSPVDDLSVQVTLTEVRADGNELLLQSGWLRAGHRAVDLSDPLRPHRSYAIEDFAPMPVDTWTRLDVAIPSVAAPLRAGSRLRMTVSNPGRNHGTWQFEAPEYAEAPVFTLGRGGAHASALHLTTLPGLAVPEALPACPSVRGQPCRVAEIPENVAAE